MNALRFLLKLVGFCAPLAIILGFPFWVMVRAGEFLPNDEIIARAMAHPTSTLIGLTFSNPVYYMQLHATIAKQPEVLVIGSSRVQQIRSDFFIDPNAAYVAAGAVQKISYFRHFIEKLPTDHGPKVIIMGLDQKFFNPHYDSLASDDIDDLLTRPISQTDVAANWSSVYRYYAQGKFSIEEIAHANSSFIGLSAIAEGAGYRGDGSHKPGYSVYAAIDPTFADIQNEVNGFEPATDVSPAALAELDALLALCAERHIYVVGFVPSFAPGVYEALSSPSSSLAQYLSSLAPQVSSVFKKYAFGFYDFSNPASLRLRTQDMQDGIHFTERGSLIMFTTMVAKDPVLRSYADPRSLQIRLADPDRQIDL